MHFGCVPLSDRPSSSPSSKTTRAAVCPTTSGGPSSGSSSTKPTRGEEVTMGDAAHRCDMHGNTRGTLLFFVFMNQICTCNRPCLAGRRAWRRSASSCACATPCGTPWKARCSACASSSCCSSPASGWWTSSWRYRSLLQVPRRSDSCPGTPGASTGRRAKATGQVEEGAELRWDLIIISLLMTMKVSSHLTS